MSINKIIRLANLFNNKYNLTKLSSNEFDWSETIESTRRGEDEDKPVQIPELRPESQHQKSNIQYQQVKSQPINPLVNKIKGEITNLKNYYSKDPSNLSKMQNIENKLKTTPVNSEIALKQLYKEIANIKSEILSSALV